MKQWIKKISILSITAALIISMSACSSQKDTSNQDNNKQAEQNAKKEEPKVEQDTKKTEQLKKEKEVSNGQVYFQGDSVIATMIIKDDISESDAKALAEKYAKELKNTYKDKKINIQAVQKGKNIVDITVPK